MNLDGTILGCVTENITGRERTRLYIPEPCWLPNTMVARLSKPADEKREIASFRLVNLSDKITVIDDVSVVHRSQLDEICLFVYSNV